MPSNDPPARDTGSAPQTMTADDVAIITVLRDARLYNRDTEPDFSADDYERILATYTELERLTAANAQQYREMVRLLDKIEALRARLAQAEADSARLDWLESQSSGEWWIARKSTTGRGFRLHNTTERTGHLHVREAIDAAARPGAPGGEDHG